MVLRLGWFSTARGEGSLAMFTEVLRSIEKRSLDASIQFVFSNRTKGEGAGSDKFFDLTELKGIPLHTLSYKEFKAKEDNSSQTSRIAYDARILELLKPYEVDLCILAGYMLIMTPTLCRNLLAINLHPSLPGGPSGTWQEIIWNLIDGWEIESGIMTHLVTEELDQGPPISFTKFSLRGFRFDQLWMEHGKSTMTEVRGQWGETYPLFQAIRKEGRERERVFLLETLKALVKGKIRLDLLKGAAGDSPTNPPLDLTPHVELSLMGGSKEVEQL